MDFIVRIDDIKINNFSDEAKNTLQSSCSEYAVSIIDESIRIEKTDRMGSNHAEIIASHVEEAKKTIDVHHLYQDGEL